MRVGIIGTGWGRVHVGTFRGAGSEIVALVGRDPGSVRRVADEEGVPGASTDPAALDDCDVVVIASPTSTHLDYLARFADRAVLCEKPLSTGSPPGAAANAARHFVNYAFPFLDSAGACARALAAGSAGALRSVTVEVRVVLPNIATLSDALFEVATHPLSFLFHVLGPFEAVSGSVGDGTATVTLSAGGIPTVLHLAGQGAPGIGYAAAFEGSEGTLRLAGRYDPGQPWRFEPVSLADRALTAGESGPPDPWYRANCRAVRAFLDVIGGHTDAAAAEQEGLFSVARAARFEASLATLRSVAGLADALERPNVRNDDQA